MNVQPKREGFIEPTDAAPPQPAAPPPAPRRPRP